jgi:hypothetical protein
VLSLAKPKPHAVARHESTVADAESQFPLGDTGTYGKF